MAGPYYVYSGAAGAGTGADWANAYTTLGTAVTGKAAGDVFYVADDHAESAASAKTITFPGTAASPNLVYCVLRSGGSVPPVSADLRTTATITTTGASNIYIGGSGYIYGITFNVGTGNNQANFSTAISADDAWLRLDSCAVKLVNTNTASVIFINGNVSSSTMSIFNNTTVSFGSTSQGFKMFGPFVWKGASSALTGATVPTTLILDASGRGDQFVFDGVDLSVAGSGKTIFGAQSSSTTSLGGTLINCRLGASVTVSATPTFRTSQPFILQISDSGATTYRQELYAYEGTLTPETTFVRTGGATDGIAPISWKMVSTANTKWASPFSSFQFPIWNTTVTGTKTVTVEIENGGTTLTNADIWLEVEYLGNASYPLSTLVSSGTADALASGTNIPTSSATWAGSLGSAVKQYLQVTISPRLVGYVRATVKLAKASATVYVDPYITLA